MPIKQISLKNFASYRDTTITDLSSSVSIFGDNGAGKSVVGQAIRYAMYGTSDAVSNKDLVREGESEMSVEIQFSAIPNPRDVVVIQRGIRNGKSSSRIELNGKVQATGEGVAKQVEELFGADDLRFRLISAFGYEGDPIIGVRSSERLETIQDIANIGIYDRFSKELAKRRKEVEKRVVATTALIENSANVDSRIELTTSESIETSKQLSEAHETLDRLSKKQADMSGEIDRMSAFVKEKDTLKVRIEGLDKQIAKEKKESTSVSVSIQRTEMEIASLNEDIQKIVSKKKTTYAKDREDKAIELKETLSKEIAELQVTISLRKSGIESSEKGQCPLCKQRVSDHSHERWQEELPVFQRSIDEKLETLKKVDRYLRKSVDMQSLLETLKASRDTKSQTCTTDTNRKKTLDIGTRQLISDRDRFKARLSVVDQQLSGSKVSIDKFNDIAHQIGFLREEIGRRSQEVASIKSTLSDLATEKRDISKKQKELKRLRSQLQAFDLVTEAFSRYGIPYDLIKGINQMTEQKASALYKFFDAGSIVVENVEDRGRPGIEYRLVNGTGTRSYKQMSTGQRVMVTFCVRMALSKIISQSYKGLALDFLILDELTGSLSQKKCESLVSIVQKLLRGSFKQVFVISHVELRDVFQTKIAIEMKNKISQARVL